MHLSNAYLSTSHAQSYCSILVTHYFRRCAVRQNRRCGKTAQPHRNTRVIEPPPHTHVHTCTKTRTQSRPQSTATTPLPRSPHTQFYLMGHRLSHAPLDAARRQATRPAPHLTTICQETPQTGNPRKYAHTSATPPAALTHAHTHTRTPRSNTPHPRVSHRTSHNELHRNPSHRHRNQRPPLCRVSTSTVITA